MTTEEQQQARAKKAVDLAVQIVEIANEPKEVGGEHQAAQGALASMGVELALICLGRDTTDADEGTPS